MILERRVGFNVEEMSTNTERLLQENISPEKIKDIAKNFLVLLNLYNSAIKEIGTKLEIIDDEFQILYSHNPIHHIERRLKSPQNIVRKLQKMGCEMNTESIMKNITDVAGIRVICYYINEIYDIADMLTKQNDIKVLKTSDYIKNPKPSGYQSLHIVVTVPVFLSNKTEIVPVEIQIRTIAMDFWASLEHQLGYKPKNNVNEELHLQLKDCAEEIALIDLKMQDIYNKIINGVRPYVA
jgi:putative GTP pyrophosphokinase